MIPRRAILAAPLAAPALAQPAWPQRAVTLLAPYPPGGSTDNFARPLAPEWSRILGQNVVIENRGGAGGTIGAEAVSRARPDGYTLLLFPTAIFTISPQMMRLPYDPDRAFLPIARVAISEAFVVIHPSVPARDARTLIEYARRNPGQIRFSSAGNATITQLQCEIFGDAAGIQLEHVPYRGSGPGITDLYAGRVQMACDPAAVPGIRDNRVIPIATFGDARHPDFPDVPTLMELGLTDRGGMSWFGVAAPAGTPPEVAARIAATLEEALRSEQVARAMALTGIRPAFETGEAFLRRIQNDRAAFGPIIQRTGARVE